MPKPAKQKRTKTAALKHTHHDRFRVAEPVRKVTVGLPKKLLEEEMKATGLGVTELFRTLLEEQRRIRGQRALLRLQGKVKWTIPYEQIKAERE